MESKVFAVLNTSITLKAAMTGDKPRRKARTPPATYQKTGERNPSIKFSARVSTAPLLTPFSSR